jgi:hypothetical protein
MTWFHWTAWALFVLLDVAAIWKLPDLWAHRSTYWDRMPRWWLWGEALFRGWVRAMPTAVVAAGGAFLPFPLLYLLEEGNAPHTSVVIVSGAFMLGGAAVMALVVFVNWPKWAVPPHLRHESGAFKQWYYQVRRRRRAT